DRPGDLQPRVAMDLHGLLVAAATEADEAVCDEGEDQGEDDAADAERDAEEIRDGVRLGRARPEDRYCCADWVRHGLDPLAVRSQAPARNREARSAQVGVSTICAAFRWAPPGMDHLRVTGGFPSCAS